MEYTAEFFCYAWVRDIPAAQAIPNDFNVFNIIVAKVRHDERECCLCYTKILQVLAAETVRVKDENLFISVRENLGFCTKHFAGSRT